MSPTSSPPELSNAALARWNYPMGGFGLLHMVSMSVLLGSTLLGAASGYGLAMEVGTRLSAPVIGGILGPIAVALGVFVGLIPWGFTNALLVMFARSLIGYRLPALVQYDLLVFLSSMGGLPESAAAQFMFRLTAPVDPASIEQAICKTCGSGLCSAPWTVCPSCQTPQHQDCVKYAGGCSTFGCSKSPNLPAAGPPLEKDKTQPGPPQG